MHKSYYSAFICLLCFGIIIIPASAQTDSLRVAVANMAQDMGLLEKKINTLDLKIEELLRENARLRTQVTAQSSNRNTQNQISNLSSAIDLLRRDYRAADQAQKNQIIAEVSRQINVLAKATQGAINTVATAVGNEPKIETPVHFSNDYPKTGITYTVRSGDTLSGISREHGSTVKYIQNANKIVNPSRDLQVGETIFIPISQ